MPADATASSTKIGIEFGRHSEDDAAFRPGPPASFYERLEALLPLRGAQVFELWTGQPAGSIDRLTAGQCWHGFDSEVALQIEPLVVLHRVECVTGRREP